MRQVGRVAGVLLDKLGADPETILHAQVAGGLHDVGKLPHVELIEAPRPLTDAERARVATHAPDGGELIRTLVPYNSRFEARRALEIAARVAELHHASPDDIDELKGNLSTRYVADITHAVQLADQAHALSDIRRKYHRGNIRSWDEIRAIVLEQTASTPLSGASPQEALDLIHDHDLLATQSTEIQNS